MSCIHSKNKVCEFGIKSICQCCNKFEESNNPIIGLNLNINIGLDKYDNRNISNLINTIEDDISKVLENNYVYGLGMKLDFIREKNNLGIKRIDTQK